MRITQIELPELRAPAAGEIKADDIKAGNIKADEIKVWTAPLTAATPGGRRLQANAALRAVLASCLAVDPDSLEFTEQPGGKPALAGGELQFNLTHSGAWSMFAVSLDTPLGIDLERPRTFPSHERFQRLVQRICSPSEQRAVATAADPPDCLRRFWVRKEAVVKAEGVGVGAGERLPVLDVMPARTGLYALNDLISPAPGYHAALAHHVAPTAPRA